MLASPNDSAPGTEDDEEEHEDEALRRWFQLLCFRSVATSAMSSFSLFLLFASSRRRRLSSASCVWLVETPPPRERARGSKDERALAVRRIARTRLAPLRWARLADPALLACVSGGAARALSKEVNSHDADGGAGRRRVADKRRQTHTGHLQLLRRLFHGTQPGNRATGNRPTGQRATGKRRTGNGSGRWTFRSRS